MIRESLSALARSESLGGLINRTPLARDVVKRVVGGESPQEAVEVASGLADRGLWVSLERAASSSDSDAAADLVVEDYFALIDLLVAAGLAAVSEISVFPDALAMNRPGGMDRLGHLTAHATSSDVAVMLGAGAPEHVDGTLGVVSALQDDGHSIGVTIPACLRRSEADCEALAGRRVRLVKGAHRGAADLVYTQPVETDKAYIRCAKQLLRGAGEPSFATHDPRLIEILQELARRYGRAQHSYEFALYLGRQEGEQERLVAAGEQVRVYVPYGPEWFERLVGGLAEQPTSIVAAVRSLLPGA